TRSQNERGEYFPMFADFRALRGEKIGISAPAARGIENILLCFLNEPEFLHGLIYGRRWHRTRFARPLRYSTPDAKRRALEVVTDEGRFRSASVSLIRPSPRRRAASPAEREKVRARSSSHFSQLIIPRGSSCPHPRPKPSLPSASIPK